MVRCNNDSLVHCLLLKNLDARVLPVLADSVSSGSFGIGSRYSYMLLSFKVQAQLCIKERNGPSEVVVIVDDGKDFHHKRLLVHANIYDYRLHSVKGQIFFKLLT